MPWSEDLVGYSRPISVELISLVLEKRIEIYRSFFNIIVFAVETLTAYIGFALTDGYALMREFPYKEPPLLGRIAATDRYAVPIFMLLATVLLLWLSSGRALRVMLALLVAPVMQVALL